MASANKNHKIPDIILEVVKTNAKRGDPEDILRVIDEYCWKHEPHTMNVGDTKGKILDKIFTEKDPKVAIELGAFLGYSAVRMGRLLKPGAKLYSIEINEDYAKVAKEMVEFAGLGDKVVFLIGPSSEVLSILRDKHGIDTVDLAFFDHFKSLYIPDLQLMEKIGLIKEGSVIVADNVIYPGNPEYLKYVRNDPKFRSECFDSHLEYRPTVQDAIEKSVYLG